MFWPEPELAAYRYHQAGRKLYWTTTKEFAMTATPITELLNIIIRLTITEISS